MAAQAVALRALSRAGNWLAEGPSLPGAPAWLLAGGLSAAFLGPLLGTALITEDDTPVFWLVLVADLLLLFALAVATFRRPVIFLGIVVLWFALQRLVIALVAPHVSADVVRLLLTYKEGFYFILVAAAAVGLALRHLRGEAALPPLLAADLAAIAFLGLLVIHFLADPGTSSPQLTYLRRFAAPAILYLGGRLLVPSRPEFREGLRLVLVVAVGVALFGIVERFFLGLSFWREGVDAATFYGRQVEAGLFPDGWVVLFHGVPDGIFIALPLEVPVRRLVSTYLEPTTLGAFLGFATLLLLLAPGLAGGDGAASRRWRLAAGGGGLFLAFAVAATISRGAMITVLAGGGLFVLVRLVSRRRLVSWRGAYVVAVPAVALLALGVVLTTVDDVPARERVRDALASGVVSGVPDEAAPPVGAVPTGESGLPEITVHPPGSTAEGAGTHFRGLTSGLREMVDQPLGAGLGAAGGWSAAPEAGRESSVGTVAAQLGLPGFILFLAFYLGLVASLVAASARSEGGPAGDIALALAGALFGLFIVSWFSESASGLLGNAFYFLFAGWALALAAPAVRRPCFQWLPGGAVEE